MYHAAQDTITNILLIAPVGHGPLIPDLAADQISSFREGCTAESVPPFYPDSSRTDGEGGPNSCITCRSVANTTEPKDTTVHWAAARQPRTELGLVGAATARRLFERFFPDDPDLADAFERRLGKQRHSPAQIQGWLLANSTDPQAAAAASGLEGRIQDIAAE